MQLGPTLLLISYKTTPSYSEIDVAIAPMLKMYFPSSIGPVSQLCMLLFHATHLRNSAIIMVCRCLFYRVNWPCILWHWRRMLYLLQMPSTGPVLNPRWLPFRITQLRTSAIIMCVGVLIISSKTTTTYPDIDVVAICTFNTAVLCRLCSICPIFLDHVCCFHIM